MTANPVFAIAVVLGASVLTTLFLTPVARSAAIAMGVVAKPRSTRWHKRPTALLGGVAIVVGTGVGLATATLLVGDGWALHSGTSSVRAALGIGLSAALMFLVGIVDDIAPVRAQAKFLFQLLAGVILLSLDAVLPLSPSYVANVVITLFWFVAVTNAFNLLDGLDGVAAGVGAIAAFFLGLTFARQGAWWHASIAWSIAGATIGFLRYNFHPASIFMGDAGSLFLGSVLAGLVVSSPGAGSASVVSVLFVPLAIVAVPLVDTTLVTITRLLAGRPISEGGLDHSTYRLVALGLSERQVAVLLYAFAMTGGLVGMWLTRLDRGLGLLLGTSFLVAMSLLAAYLGRMQIAHVSNVRKAKAVTLLVRNLLYKRRLAELLLDVVLIALAYYGAYRLRFDNVLPLPYAEAFEATIGLVIATKVAALVAFGVYRGAWEYASIFDLYRVIGAVLVAGLGIFLYAEWRVPTLAASHSIVYIDVLLTAALILTSRLSFRSLEMLRERLQVRGERVLIYGAGDGGELILRELRNHHELQLRPVCFLDDDLRRHGTQIHGVPVVGGFDSLGVAARRFGVNKIVIGTKELSVEGVRAITAVAEGLGLEVAEVAFGVKWIPTIGMQDDVSSPSVEERQAV